MTTLSFSLALLFCAVANPPRIAAYVPTSKSFFNKDRKSLRPLFMSSSSSSAKSLIDAMSSAASESLGRKVELETASGGGYAGGGGASTSAVVDKLTDTKYFVKSASGGFDMLRAEYEGVKAMSNTNTIQVPTPIAFGEYEKTNQGFAIFEYLNFCGGGSQYELGVQLAKVRKKKETTPVLQCCCVAYVSSIFFQKFEK